MTPHDVLLNALHRLETDGWNKGTLTRGDTTCVLGAIMCEAHGVEPEYLVRRGHGSLRWSDPNGHDMRVAATMRVLDMIQKETGRPTGIPEWNDALTTEFHHVRSVLKRAADLPDA